MGGTVGNEMLRDVVAAPRNGDGTGDAGEPTAATAAASGAEGGTGDERLASDKYAVKIKQVLLQPKLI